MDDGLKQRLVGAIVLIVLAAVILPAVLREPAGSSERNQSDPIPQRPKFEVVTSIVKDTDSARQQLQARLDKERASYVAESLDAETINSGQGPKVAASSATKASKQDKTQASAETRSSRVRQSAAPLAPAWSIQVASFEQKDNASKLEQKLLEQDYRAYVNRSSVNGEALYRVMVGPDIQKERAERTLIKLEENMQFKGILVRFHP